MSKRGDRIHLGWPCELRHPSATPKSFGPAKGDLHLFPFTDVGNGQRIAYRFKEDIRYCHPEKCWYIFTGTRWEPDHSGEMMQRAKLIPRRTVRRSRQH